MNPQTNDSSVTNEAASLCDFLVIIALEEEFKYFSSALNLAYEAEERDGLSAYTFRLRAPGGGYAKGVVSFLGDMGIADAQLHTYRLIDLYRPGLVASIGISGIIDSRLRLGDVAMATESDDVLYRSKIIQKDPTQPLTFEDLKYGGESYRTTEQLCDKLKNFKFSNRDSWDAWVNNSVGEVKSLLSQKDLSFLKENKFVADWPEVYFDPVACGPWVGAADKLKKILRLRNRNFLAMDMESVGVLAAAYKHRSRPQTVVLRGMSDLADERKEQLDEINSGAIRRWAMDNASHLFGLLIENVEVSSYSKRRTDSPGEGASSGVEVAEKLHRDVVRQYLQSPYEEHSSVQDYSYADYSALFSFITAGGADTPSHLFDKISEAVQSSSSPQPLRVEGLPGTGKTSFLSILYWYFFDLYTQGKSDLLPVFINLHHYNELIPQRDNTLPLQNQVVNAIKRDLSPLEEHVRQSPSQPLLVIVDGYDEFARFQVATWDYLSEMLRTCRHLKVVGSRESPDQTGANPADKFDAVYRLRSVEVSDPAFGDFIKSFLKVASPSAPATAAGPVREAIARIKLKTVDLFTLSLLLENYKHERNNVPYTFSEILKSYCRRFLEQRLSQSSSRADALDRAAKLAFAYEIKEERNFGDEEEDRVFLDLIQRHVRLREFLVAHFVTSELLKITRGDIKAAESLRFVYPFRVNRLCKEIINQSPKTQYKVAQAVEFILKADEVHPYAKAQACYFAGRLEHEQAKGLAKKALEALSNSFEVQDRKSHHEKPDEFHLLLWRSLYISLIYLGNSTAQRKYVEGLLSDPQKDSINRGFHLEYYGDQPVINSAMLSNRDNLGPYAKTFEQLYSNLKSSRNNPIFEIEVHTLCSLAQHRHVIGRFKDADRARLVSLIEELLKRQRIRNESLKNYVHAIGRHLEQQPFTVGGVFDSYYKIKRVKRSGWVDRGILDGESVADHSYGAYLLALFLLPDTSDDKSYSKEGIMNMLLAHDLSEAITGDILPKNKSEETDRREREVYEEIKMLGTYDGLGRMEKVAELWEEFKAGATLNARVAKDLDRLENLVQLWIYKAEGQEIRDFDSWRQELLDAVETDPGLQVMEKLKGFYEREGEVPTGEEI